MKDFRKLIVWERAHKFALRIYEITNSFPTHELYGLTSQLRRASVSIPTNIAEGCGKNSQKDFVRFLTIASGSASEVQYLLILSRDLKYSDYEILDSLDLEITEIKKMLFTLIDKIS